MKSCGLEETGGSELEGSLEPIKSQDGELIAYRRMTVFKADKRSEPKRPEGACIV